MSCKNTNEVLIRLSKEGQKRPQLLFKGYRNMKILSIHWQRVFYIAILLNKSILIVRENKKKLTFEV